MNLFGMMSTSGDAMQAERMRAEVVAANMANAETTRTGSGGPYHRQHVVFAANQNASTNFLDTMASATGIGTTSSSPVTASSLGSGASVAPGVHISAVVEDSAPPLKRYDPGHPDADAQGYVSYPDINPLTEMVDLMGATRAYGLNGSAVQAEKSMISSAIDIAKG
jgi:flagellar basal-body rod protein FlgC